MLEVRDLCKYYKKNKVVSDVSFLVDAGDIVGYIGPNGARKTTTLKMICNLAKKDKGTVLLEEKKRIGVIFDENGLYMNMTAYENVLFFVKLYSVNVNKEDIERILCFVGLDTVMDCIIKGFSKGMLRRLVIARILICNPDVLIMDEPFDGVDIESQCTIIDFLRNWVKTEQKSIIITSHNMKEIQNFCTKIIFLNNGRVILNDETRDIIQAHFKGLRIRLLYKENINQVIELMSQITTKCEILEDSVLFYVEENKCQEIINIVLENQIAFREVIEESMTLEEIYMSEVVNHE